MVILSALTVDLFGYIGAALGYLLLTIFAFVWWKRDLGGLLLMLACFVTAAWAAVTGLGISHGIAGDELSQIFEVCRSASWILLLFSLFFWIAPAERLRWAVILVVASACIALSPHMLSALSFAPQGDWPQQIFFIAHIALALIGLAVIENLFRNSPKQRGWTIKYLCFGAGGMAAFDFFLYADAFLFHHLDVDFMLLRGIISLLALPFFAVYAKRNSSAGPLLAVSREITLYSMTFIVAGIYLLSMTMAGYYVRRFGGSWSTFLQGLFVFGAVFLLLVPIASGTVRANLRVLVEKHFFASRYDYRREWVRFTRTIADRENGNELRVRVIQAIADIVGSPEGGLLLPNESGEFSLAGVWNLSRWHLSTSEALIPQESSLLRFVERTKWIIDLYEYERNPDRYVDIGMLPPWLRPPSNAWLVVPLFLTEQLIAFVIVGQARAARTLTWEDFDILKTVGQQAASYLAQQKSDEALAEVRQFDSFNKRFAFVAHDIKNLVSQLSLLLRNSERHGANPAFQNDMLATVRQSVEKLNGMLYQLKAAAPSGELSKAILLEDALREIVGRSEAASPVALTIKSHRTVVMADAEQFKAAIGHLVQNAVDAIGASGRVEVRLGSDQESALIEIADDGPGMNQAFVRDRLFRPFDSTKATGYGIGMYQSREYVRSLGGRIDVDSTPGRGTTMRVTLPLSKDRPTGLEV